MTRRRQIDSSPTPAIHMRRPRSESTYPTLAPSVSTTLSIKTEPLSPQSAPLPLACFPRRSLKSGLQICSSKIQSIRHPWSPIVPSTLPRDSSRPFCPPSMFTSQAAIWLLHQIGSTTPCPVHSLYRTPLQMDAPSNVTPPTQHTRLFQHSPQGLL